ncbi:2-C-methyl-D-erythritol 4-phosphate cytidylyltransferase [Bacillus sp. CRN 9]|nr:2-C-methyl-D-erythritol 4-phosphate cytidylyltransferase [Bacillus sp. CRN 9]
MSYRVVIPAAGQGKRMGAGKNKLFLELHNEPVLIHTLKIFERDTNCEGVFLAINPLEELELKETISHYGITKVKGYIPGGNERQYSVHNVVKQLTDDGVILVHDGARPFLQTELITRLVAEAEHADGAILAVPMKDTVKRAQDGFVHDTIDRSNLWSVQTPQAFKLSILSEAHRRAEEDSYVGTDDASLVERLNAKIAIVEGDYDNIKLTTPEDLYFAEAIIKKRKNQL